MNTWISLGIFLFGTGLGAVVARIAMSGQIKGLEREIAMYAGLLEKHAAIAEPSTTETANVNSR